MPDDNTKDLLGQAGIWLGGGGALAALGVLLRGVLTGSLGQEKEVRDSLATENKRLAVDLSAERDESSQLRQDIRQLSRMHLYMLNGRAEARAALNALEKLQGLPITAWPPDPPETLNTPAGGPP